MTNEHQDQHTHTNNTQRTTHNTEHARWHRQFCLPKIAHLGLSLDPEVHQRNPWISHNFSLRKDREQHVPDSSNHSLYLIKLFSFSNLEGSSGGNQQPDGSISLSLSPPPLPHPPQQHTTRNTQRHRDTEKQRHRQRQNPSFTDDLHVRHFSMMFG